MKYIKNHYPNEFFNIIINNINNMDSNSFIIFAKNNYMHKNETIKNAIFERLKNENLTLDNLK